MFSLNLVTPLELAFRKMVKFLWEFGIISRSKLRNWGYGKLNAS